MSETGTDRAVFVFDPDARYGLVQEIREAGAMPTKGLRYVAAVTGPWKIVKVMAFAETEGLIDVVPRLDAPGDPETATSLRAAQVRRSRYKRYTALLRIHTSVADPETLIEPIGEAIGSDNGYVEADVVMGAFDILACVVDDDDTNLGQKIVNVRRIDGVARTASLRVIDYVSTSENAPGEHQVAPAD